MTIKRLFAIIFIFICTFGAWMLLGGVTTVRTEENGRLLKKAVVSLYGDKLTIKQPTLVYIEKKQKQGKNANGEVIIEEYEVEHAVFPEKSKVKVELELDPRKKGVLWFPTYKARYDAQYEFDIRAYQDKDIFLKSELSSSESIYKNVQLKINDKKIEDISFLIKNEKKKIDNSKDKIVFNTSYDTTGLEQFSYIMSPGYSGIAQIDSLFMTINTDFHDIDFVEKTLTATEKTRTEEGWILLWKLDQSITGKDIGIVIPGKLNPGDIIPRAVFAAPISLLFYFMIIIVLSVVKKESIHPVNYFFLACAFFSFHLMYSYFSDHLNIYISFIIASIVSMVLVSSYLRLFTGKKIAYVYSPIAQLIYLIVFSYSFFYKGYSGLIITIISVCSLFFLMQITGKIDWQKVFE